MKNKSACKCRDCKATTCQCKDCAKYNQCGYARVDLCRWVEMEAAMHE